VTQRLRMPLLLFALFLAAWVPRVLALDRFVTYDERKWLARSANFYQAISHGDLAHTFQREHPGVTVMWAGMLGFVQYFPAYAQIAPGQFAWEREAIEAWLYEQGGATPLELLAAGRWWIVLAIALAITGGFFPLRRLFGEQMAILATLFIAWDPFFLALSRQLHPDGLVSSLIFLALLCFVGWLYGGQNRAYLIISGLVMGLAWLTKTPAIFLVPTGALLISLEFLYRRHHPPLTNHQSPITNHRSTLTLLSGYIAWGLLATLTFVALWPAMWIDPLGTLLRMGAEMSDYTEGHVNTNYFLGQITNDPGLIFYPIAWLFRTTPAVLIGLIAAGIAAWRRAWPFDEPHRRRAALALLLFALLFSVGMTLGAKKFDRYILPSFLALDVLALLGWVNLTQRLPKLLNRRNRSVILSPFHLVILSSFLLHALPGFLQYPYYLTYFNPLTGGTRTAPQVLFAGWGEGLDAAAAWLNAQPDADQLRVVAWYADGPLSYFFKGQATSLGNNSPLLWLDSDYAVLYVNQWQRQIPSAEAVAYFDGQTPVHVVRFGGLELARIYDMRNTVLPAFIDIGKESAADFGGQIRLAAYKLDQQTANPGDSFQTTFYLQSRAPMTVNYNVLVRLVGQDGAEIWRAEGWPWGAPTTDWPLREIRPDGHTVVIPTDAKPGLYKFLVSFYDPDTLANLPLMAVNSDQALDEQARDVALLWIGPPPAVTQNFAQPWHFDPFFTLSGGSLPDQVAPGGDLSLRLQWASVKRTATEYTTFVHLVDAAGNLVAQKDQMPLGGFAPTRLWQPGQQIVDTYTIPLPADLPAGEYAVRVGLYGGDGVRLPVLQNGTGVGDFAAVGSVRVP